MWKYIIILAALLYILSPYDFLPDYIAGWGWLDDIAVLIILWQVLKRLKQASGDYQAHHTGGHQANDGTSSDSSRQGSGKLDPYKILGVTPRATPGEIKTAYRHLASQYHPDKVAHLGEEFRALAEKRFKEIQEAYQQLTRK